MLPFLLIPRNDFGIQGGVAKGGMGSNARDLDLELHPVKFISRNALVCLHAALFLAVMAYMSISWVVLCDGEDAEMLCRRTVDDPEKKV